MNQLVLMPYRSNSLSIRGIPTSPANTPRWMSLGESSPPYEPSQPATASTSTPRQIWMSLGMGNSPFVACGESDAVECVVHAGDGVGQGGLVGGAPVALA